MNRSKYGKKIVFWSFPEHREQERSRGWYVLAVIIGSSFLLYAVLTANFLFAIIIIIVAIILFFRTLEAVKNIQFAIYEDGVRIEDKFYGFKEIKDFYVIYEPPEVKSLYFNFHSFFHPRVQILLEDKNPIKIREILLDYLEEDLDQEDEPFSDSIGRMFKL